MKKPDLSILAALIVVALCSACMANTPAAPTKLVSAARSEPSDILHITMGGIAAPDAGEAGRHWSNWTINLIDGSEAYGWTSQKDISFPHALNFELAGAGAISGVVLDSTFAPVVREDGSSSQSPDASPVREFRVLGSTTGPDGPWFAVAQGEAAKNERSRFDLPTPVKARWLRLVINGNWAGGGQTRLAEFAVLGTLERRDAPALADVSGEYAHEYGPIVLRQEGDVIHGCYTGGAGQLEGMILGRTMRLAWRMPDERSIGMATLVVADGKLYGFWYRDGDRMGSPWNAVKIHELKDVKLGACTKYLYPTAR